MGEAALTLSRLIIKTSNQVWLNVPDLSLIYTCIACSMHKSIEKTADILHRRGNCATGQHYGFIAGSMLPADC